MAVSKPTIYPFTPVVYPYLKSILPCTHRATADAIKTMAPDSTNHKTIGRIVSETGKRYEAYAEE